MSERPFRSEEEIKQSGIERARKNDAKSDKEAGLYAQGLLENMGLNMEDLRGKQVLDLGSGPSMVERAARNQGIEGGYIA